MGKKYEQHLECTRIIRLHRDWTDEQVLEAAGMRALEVNIVQEARREVENEQVKGDTSWQRSY